MKFLINLNRQKYWHKQTPKVRRLANEMPDADEYKRKHFLKPKWCIKPDAHIFHVDPHEGMKGCSRIELTPQNVSNKQCAKCQYHFNHPNNILARPAKKSPVKPVVKNNRPSIAKYAREYKETTKPRGNRVMYKVSILLAVFWAVGHFGFHASFLFHIILMAALSLAAIQGISDLHNWADKKK